MNKIKLEYPVGKYAQNKRHPLPVDEQTNRNIWGIGWNLDQNIGDIKRRVLNEIH
jgi:hypothetical protein